MGTPRDAGTPDAEICRGVVERLGGRFSAEMGIDLDAGSGAVERWFLAATLFGNRISTALAERAWRTLADAGVSTIQDIHGRTWDELVALLDAGGYARYDFRTATRLQRLADAVGERTGGGIEPLSMVRDPVELEAALDDLPGWGPITVRLFLRELRGVWPGADPPVDDRAVAAARHLRLSWAASPARGIEGLAEAAGLDRRDLEAALVRLTLRHGRSFESCPGGSRCIELDTG